MKRSNPDQPFIGEMAEREASATAPEDHLNRMFAAAHDLPAPTPADAPAPDRSIIDALSTRDTPEG